jgi:hypothetical protein
MDSLPICFWSGLIDEKIELCGEMGIEETSRFDGARERTWSIFMVAWGGLLSSGFHDLNPSLFPRFASSPDILNPR